MYPSTFTQVISLIIHFIYWSFSVSTLVQSKSLLEYFRFILSVYTTALVTSYSLDYTFSFCQVKTQMLKFSFMCWVSVKMHSARARTHTHLPRPFCSAPNKAEPRTHPSSPPRTAALIPRAHTGRWELTWSVDTRPPPLTCPLPAEKQRVSVIVIIKEDDARCYWSCDVFINNVDVSEYQAVFYGRQMWPYWYNLWSPGYEML